MKKHITVDFPLVFTILPFLKILEKLSNCSMNSIRYELIQDTRLGLIECSK